MRLRLSGRSALKPAGFLFVPGGLLVAFSGFAAGLPWLAYFGIMLTLLGAGMIFVTYRSEKAQQEFLGVWMPGYLFFFLGTTFLFAALTNLSGHGEQGRVAVLGGIASTIGFFVLASAAFQRIRHRNDPERGTLNLKRLLSAVGLIVAGLVLLFFYVIGFTYMFLRPDAPMPGVVFVAIPTIFLLIFGTIFYFTHRRNE